MDPATLGVIASVVSTGGALYGAYSQYEAGKDAEKAAKKETAENIRRAAAEDRAKMAETRARLGASNVQPTGSPLRYMSEMEKEQGLQRAWTSKAGKYRAKALRDEGTTGAIGSLVKIPGYWT